VSVLVAAQRAAQDRSGSEGGWGMRRMRRRRGDEFGVRDDGESGVWWV
jgi:hypothetical protein